MNVSLCLHLLVIVFLPFGPVGMCHVAIHAVQSARELEGFPRFLRGGGSVFWVGMGTRHAGQARFGWHTVSLTGRPTCRNSGNGQGKGGT